MLERLGELAFIDATTRLNGMNLPHLWHTCTLLSLLEREHGRFGQTGSLFPLLNAPRVNMFAKAILASTALPYKSRTLSNADFGYVFNRINDASTDPTQFPSRTPELDGRRRLAGFLHTLANSQFPYQNPDPIARMGRAYALSSVIPTLHRDALQRRLGVRFLDPTSTTLDDAGTVVDDVLDTLFRALVRVQMSGKPFGALFDRLSSSTVRGVTVPPANTPDQSRLLKAYLATAWPHTRLLPISMKSLALPSDGDEGPARIRRVVTHVARTTHELRTMQSTERHYQLGFVAHRLSPLERFPLVLLNSESFVVPAVPYLERLIGDAPHYLLQDHPELATAFRETRGFAQEYYLQQLLAEREPSLVQIPERPYAGPNGRIDGPDLTLIDRQRGRLIAIESKARRITVETRVDPDLEAFRTNLADGIRAMLKLPQKIDDMLTRTDVYGDHAESIAHALEQPPIGVVVIGDGTPLLTELVREVLTDAESEALDAARARLMVMGLDLFDLAVDVAVEHNVPLAQILDEYWLDTSLPADELARSERPAADFRGRELPRPTDRFATRFADDVFAKLGYGPDAQPTE